MQIDKMEVHRFRLMMLMIHPNDLGTSRSCVMLKDWLHANCRDIRRFFLNCIFHIVLYYNHIIGWEDLIILWEFIWSEVVFFIFCGIKSKFFYIIFFSQSSEIIQIKLLNDINILTQILFWVLLILKSKILYFLITKLLFLFVLLWYPVILINKPY